jgi:hypothetical protein
MRQPRGDLDLTQEPLRTQRGSELGSQHLEGDLALMPEVLGKIHDRHSAAAQFPVDDVTIGEDRLQNIEDMRDRRTLLPVLRLR